MNAAKYANGGGTTYTAIGVWKMDDEGGWELQEPYKTYLLEAKLHATQGWRESLYAYLADKCPYTRDELNAELLRRVDERKCTAMELVDEFVIEALSGNLLPH